MMACLRPHLTRDLCNETHGYTQRMTHIQEILYAYAVIVLLGGIMGYASSKSTASLVSSIPAAIIVAIGSYLVMDHRRIGVGIGILVSVILAIFFGIRYS